jgi:hypothetical protein
MRGGGGGGIQAPLTAEAPSPESVLGVLACVPCGPPLGSLRREPSGSPHGIPAKHDGQLSVFLPRPLNLVGGLLERMGGGLLERGGGRGGDAWG